MKKLFLVFVLFTFFGSLSYGDTGEQEEIDFLLFFPNSSNRFVNERQAMLQLDNLAKYLMTRNLLPGQINVYGYAAAAVNEIDSVDLSRDRAFYVISELQKRGISKNLFSDPVGHGSVDLWGRNTNEEDRIPNRRVRVLLDGNVLTPETLVAADPVIETPVADTAAEVINQKKAKKEAEKNSPWRYLLAAIPFLITAAIFYFTSNSRKVLAARVAEFQKAVMEAPVVAEPPVVAAAPVISYTTVNLDEEIRFRAYELYQQRNDQNGDADGDWYSAVCDISARYEALGCQVYTEDGHWWARRAVEAGMFLP